MKELGSAKLGVDIARQCALPDPAPITKDNLDDFVREIDRFGGRESSEAATVWKNFRYQTAASMAKWRLLGSIQVIRINTSPPEICICSRQHNSKPLNHILPRATRHVGCQDRAYHYMLLRDWLYGFFEIRLISPETPNWCDFEAGE
jgi:hypothetical protein